MCRRVHAFQVGAGSRPRGERTDRLGIGAGVEAVHDGSQPLRPLGMAAAGLVGLEAGIGGDEQHKREATDSLAPKFRPASSLRWVYVSAARAQSYRFRGGVARVAAWHGRPDVASLALRGADAPSPRTLHRLLDRLRSDGYREVVTNALAPGASLPFVDIGFAVRGRLHMLVHDLAELAPPSGRTRKAARRDRDTILAVDAAAFDDFWQFDAIALREATRATPRTHVRVAPPHGELSGYGLFGRAATTGYVQRLAVAAATQGEGYGRALLTDGLHWLRDQGAARAFVNTQEHNDRALDLYTRAGFSQLPVGLCVLGREL